MSLLLLVFSVLIPPSSLIRLIKARYISDYPDTHTDSSWWMSNKRGDRWFPIICSVYSEPTCTFRVWNALWELEWSVLTSLGQQKLNRHIRCSNQCLIQLRRSRTDCIGLKVARVIHSLLMDRISQRMWLLTRRRWYRRFVFFYQQMGTYSN